MITRRNILPVRAKLTIPASLPDDAVKKIQDMSLQAFNAIDGAGLARVDFFYLSETGEILINEINYPSRFYCL